METAKIRGIEDILDKLSNCQSDVCDNLIDDLLSAICDALKISLSANPTSSLFSDRTNLRQKEFISACLLRTLSRKPDIFWDLSKASLRNKVCALFDQSLSEIYTSLDINSKDDNNEKLQKLQDIERDLLNGFHALNSSISSIEECLTIKSKFMRLLYAEKSNYFVVSQFTDGALIERDRVLSLFQLLEDYMDSSSVESVVQSYRNIQKEYSCYIQEIDANSSNLTCACLGTLFNTILSTVQEDFDSRDELVPTEVEAEASEKKYPFHMEGREINIGILAKNNGKGKAFDVEALIQYDDSFLTIANPIISLGSLEPGEIREFYLEATTQKALQTDEPEIICIVISWKDYSGVSNERNFDGELLSQDPNLDWEEMSGRKPYILEAVSEEKQLVGRNELLKQLSAKLILDQLESSIIYGQKRVGKSSIAITVQNKIRTFENYTAIYLLVGRLDISTPEKCLKSLGEFIFDEISYEFQDLKLPELQFEDSITPLDRLFRILKRLKPDHKFVIIIDEFDEIPSELYRITSIGDNFFNNIRSLSSENNIGFILVGGENMKIIKQSTDKLNKFESLSVDYFDSERFWNDFQDLVRRPVSGTIEFTDDAIIALYEATEGNPFFAKLICSNIYRRACETRNSYVSQEEVEIAIASSLKSLDTNNVNYVESGDRRKITGEFYKSKDTS